MSKSEAGSHPDPRGAERFHEERAAYTVSRAQPNLEAGIEAIREMVKVLKAVPGVYRMIDARGDVLYVGKARSLKARVANYTQVNGLTTRLMRMVSQCRSMEIITTNSEAEALLLEAQLIKRYRPPFNVLLRDDKSFPFILLRADHEFPRIHKHRGARRAKGNYYGPFASAGSVNTTLNALQKLFLLRSCTDSFFNNRDRPCLLYQIKRCSAPCVGRISTQDYDTLVRQAKDFLAGKSGQVQADLEKQMAVAADSLDFETAAILRDRLRAATFIQGSQAINAKSVGDADVFALAAQGGHIGVQAFFIRGGQNWGHRAFFPSQTKDVEEDQVLANVMLQFYEEVPPPPTVLVDRDLPETELMEAALSELSAMNGGRKVQIAIPQRGDRRKLLAQAQRNAVEALERRIAETGTKAKVHRELAEFLELEEPPRRIEVYDNSHIQGAKAVGAMVVASPEGFEKSQYRKFNIREAQSNDDFGMMREVMLRRFRKFAEAGERDEELGQPDTKPDTRPDTRPDIKPVTRSGHDTILPDLLLIDGGKGQVSSVMQVLEEYGLADQFAVIGIAKGPHHGREGREVFHFPDGREKTLPTNSPVLFYAQRLRDEVHRYVIGAHRAKRSKAITASPLDEIPGIGPARKRALLLHFGTASKVRAAALEDLQRAPGVSEAVARKVYDFYHAGG